MTRVYAYVEYIDLKDGTIMRVYRVQDEYGSQCVTYDAYTRGDRHHIRGYNETHEQRRQAEDLIAGKPVISRFDYC
jgi:hypothetical protein